MKKLNIYFLALLALSTIMVGITSCGEDDPCTGTALDYEGTFIGRYLIASLIEINNDDTITVTVNGNTVTLTSSLLSETFETTYDPATGRLTIDALTIAELPFDGDTLRDITVTSGRASLNGKCDVMFLTLNNVTVNDGTIDLPSPLSYPLGPVQITTSSNNPLNKQ